MEAESGLRGSTALQMTLFSQCQEIVGPALVVAEGQAEMDIRLNLESVW
jgi:hypothetical protein